MNSCQQHDAAQDFAKGRTTYSLAREVLGLRAQVAELELQTSQLSAQLVENDVDRDRLAATLDEIGRLCPTDYQDRSELFAALLRILQRAPAGARARAEASALRRYAMRLHDRHDWRDHLLVEADRIEQHAAQFSSVGAFPEQGIAQNGSNEATLEQHGAHLKEAAP